MLVAAIVPTKDEEPEQLLIDLMTFCDEVIRVDADPNFEQSIGDGILEVSDPHGLAGAYATGEGVVSAQWWSVHVDAGGSHDPKDVSDLLDIADISQVDVVIGSRFCPGGEFHGPLTRKARSRTMAAMMNLISQKQIADWTSGMRVYSPKARALLAEHEFRTQGHAWQIESLWVCLKAGLTYTEAPITYITGHSHMSLGRAWEAAKLWGHLATSS